MPEVVVIIRPILFTIRDFDGSLACPLTVSELPPQLGVLLIGSVPLNPFRNLQPANVADPVYVKIDLAPDVAYALAPISSFVTKS